MSGLLRIVALLVAALALVVGGTTIAVAEHSDGGADAAKKKKKGKGKKNKKKYNTDVTITPFVGGDGVGGRVTSENSGKCTGGREVKLFQNGTEVAQGTSLNSPATFDHGTFEFEFAAVPPGTQFYVVAPKRKISDTKICKAATSFVEEVPTPDPDF